MRAYLVTFGLGACITFAVATFLFFFCDGTIVQENFWAATATAKKIELARRIREPRILIVGGSNAHFGLRAQMIEAATRRPAVNLATHAGMGLNYIFFLMETVLRPGDIVVLPLEYDAYLDSSPLLNQLNVSVSYSFGLEYFRHLNWMDRIHYIRELTPRQVWHATLIRLGLVPALTRAPAGYQPDSIDRWGDETDAANPAVPPDNISNFVRRICPAPLYPLASGITALRRFIAWTEANGVQVLATWPNVLADECEAGAQFKAREAEIRRLYRELGVTMIGTPEQAFLPFALMQDSVNHPTVRGAMLRTARFIKELCTETSVCAQASAAGTPAAAAAP
jgi:hypothetical protein